MVASVRKCIPRGLILPFLLFLGLWTLTFLFKNVPIHSFRHHLRLLGPMQPQLGRSYPYQNQVWSPIPTLLGYVIELFDSFLPSPQSRFTFSSPFFSFLMSPLTLSFYFTDCLISNLCFTAPCAACQHANEMTAREKGGSTVVAVSN